MTGLALSRTVLLLPMIVVRRRKSLRLRHHVWRSLGQTIGNIVQFLLVWLIVDQGAGGQCGGQQGRQFKRPSVSIDHWLYSTRLAWARSGPARRCVRSKLRTGSFWGTSDTRAALRTNTRNTRAAYPPAIAISIQPSRGVRHNDGIIKRYKSSQWPPSTNKAITLS